MRILFEGAPDTILVVDADGAIVAVNERAKTTFGYDASELLGKPIEALIPSRFAADHVEHRQAYIRCPQTRAMGRNLELWGLRKDGTEVPVDIMLSPVNCQGKNMAMAIVRDVSERKRAEDEARELARQREDYVATLTHDLKTPILAANRAIKLLLDGDFGPLSESQVPILRTIIDSNDAMFKMVATLLDVYRYDSGAKRLCLSEQDLAESLSHWVHEISTLADSKEIRLECLVMPALSLVFDGEELRRVIQNLLDNAIKFTPPGGVIEVTVADGEHHVQITVSDTGKGISPADQAQLFERFWQPRSSGRLYASTGLGLYLCRKIVELHGGKIWSENRADRNGARFHLTLPKKKSSDC